MADGIAIEFRGRRTMLKWHRLRRERYDTTFTARRLAEGLALGASMEVDLEVYAGGGLAVLHEEELSKETTGEGAVATATADYLRSLCLRDNKGAPTNEPVRTLPDLVALVRGGSGNGIVQLDFKDGADKVTADVVTQFAEALRGVSGRFALSGGDWRAIIRLSEAVPSLSTGYDPCDRPEAAGLASPEDFAGFAELVANTAPAARMIYLAYPLVFRALDAGFDLIDAFHGHGMAIDAWTLNSDHPDAAKSLSRLIEAKVDQITTDEPGRLEEMWRAEHP